MKISLLYYSFRSLRSFSAFFMSASLETGFASFLSFSHSASLSGPKKGFLASILFIFPFRLNLFKSFNKLLPGEGLRIFHSLLKFLLTHRKGGRYGFWFASGHTEYITTYRNKYEQKISQWHQNFLISTGVAFRAWRDTIRSLNSKIYKMGMDAWQNPTLKKTGSKSFGCEISKTLAWESSMASSSHAVDLMPWRCSSVMERKEWSNFILRSMGYGFKKTGRGSLPVKSNVVLHFIFNKYL